MGTNEEVTGAQPEVEPAIRLVVGLGNPGRHYARTRHNVGFWCVDLLAKEHSIALSRRRPKAVIGEGVIGGVSVALAKPRSFVNESGWAVRFLLDRYHATPANIVVVYDDMNLPLGSIRLRPRGSSGGHNGMKSIIDAVSTQEFPRLRIGIGRPPTNSDDIEYVLGRMSRAEREIADKTVAIAAQAITVALTEGVGEAMNRFN